MEAQTALVIKKTISDDFKKAVKGKLDKQHIDATVSSMAATTASYGAKGSVASMIFYLRFQVTVNGGKTFDGNAGGISTPGGGALFGDIYTNDLNLLYSNTHSFQFNSTPVYLNINFFDKSSNFLGSFQSGAVSTVTGTGGGTGSWK